MNMIVFAADGAAEVDHNPILNTTILDLFVAAALFIVNRAGCNNKTAADYYAAGRSFTGPQNGFAIPGDYLSAASFLGICGAIAVNGHDGFRYSNGLLVGWLVALLLVAELKRNTGEFTRAAKTASTPCCSRTCCCADPRLRVEIMWFRHVHMLFASDPCALVEHT